MLFQTIFVYSSLLIVMFLCGIVSAKRTANTTISCSFWKWENLLPILFFAVIMGLRYDVGQDHLTYLFSYKNGGGYIERYEPIFKFVASEFREFGLHPFWFFAFWAFIQIFFVYYALKDERYLMPFVAISLITGEYFLYWMNGIRQELAACIFFFSIIFIVDKKSIKYLLCCLLAFCFHKTAIILIPLYPILVRGNDLTINRIFQYLLYIVAFIIALTDVDVISHIIPSLSFLEYTSYANYLSEGSINHFNDVTVKGNSIAYKLLFFINLIIIFYSDKMKQYFSNRKFTIIYNLYYWGSVFVLIFINNLVFERPFRYFNLFNMVMISYTLFYLWKNSKRRQNLFFFVTILSLLLLLFARIIKNYPFNFI